MRPFRNLLITGGAGFIGTNFIRYLFGAGSVAPAAFGEFTGRIVNLDALTYAGNASNLSDIESRYGNDADPQERGRYVFVQGDICDRVLVEDLFTRYAIDGVVHFAAESHVDRSILDPEAFIRTNVLGTFTLLDVARRCWKDRDGTLFHHVSTDEVYGSLGDGKAFTEGTPYAPGSPYSASKASSDHLAQAFFHTYGLPVTISNCSNNYGPYQYPEKLIPLMIVKMLEGTRLPVYGDGRQVRDWIHVDDHASAVWAIMNRGTPGERFNIGGEDEWENIRLVSVLADLIGARISRAPRDLLSLVTHVEDRPGHDRRYAINCDKIRRELGWRKSWNFLDGLERTVDWYLSNKGWIRNAKASTRVARTGKRG